MCSLMKCTDRQFIAQTEPNVIDHYFSDFLVNVSFPFPFSQKGLELIKTSVALVARRTAARSINRRLLEKATQRNSIFRFFQIIFFVLAVFRVHTT